MSTHATRYDEGHTTLLQPRGQQTVLVLGRPGLGSGNHGLRPGIDVDKGKLLAVSKVLVQAVTCNGNGNSH